MRKYTYIDREAGSVIGVVHCMASRAYGRPFDVHDGVKVFECEASSIIEADDMLKVATGRIASKEGGLCCSFEE